MKRYLWGTISVWILTTGLLLWYILLADKKIEYEALSLQSDQKEQVSTQKRKNVRKDLYFFQGGERLHSYLYCDSSKLVFQQDGGSKELAERMEKISSIVQESRGGNGDWQWLRSMEADQGVYYYSKNLFTASKVSLFRYLAKGSDLESNIDSSFPSIKGVAKEVTFQFGKEVQFQAKQLHANLYSMENR